MLASDFQNCLAPSHISLNGKGPLDQINKVCVLKLQFGVDKLQVAHNLPMDVHIFQVGAYKLQLGALNPQGGGFMLPLENITTTLYLVYPVKPGDYF